MITRLDIWRTRLFEAGIALMFVELMVIIIVRTAAESFNWRLVALLAITAMAAGCGIIKKSKRVMIATWRELGQPLGKFPITLSQQTSTATRMWAQEKLEELAKDLEEKSTEAKRLHNESAAANYRYANYVAMTKATYRDRSFMNDLSDAAENALDKKLNAEKREKEVRIAYQEAWALLAGTPYDKANPGIDLVPEVRRKYQTSKIFLDRVRSSYDNATA